MFPKKSARTEKIIAWGCVYGQSYYKEKQGNNRPKIQYTDGDGREAGSKI